MSQNRVEATRFPARVTGRFIFNNGRGIPRMAGCLPDIHHIEPVKAAGGKGDAARPLGNSLDSSAETDVARCDSSFSVERKLAPSRRVVSRRDALGNLKTRRKSQNAAAVTHRSRRTVTN